jgi:hypothetical protein
MDAIVHDHCMDGYALRRARALLDVLSDAEVLRVVRDG